MKLIDIREMAVRGGNLTDVADSWAQQMKKHIDAAEDKEDLGSIDKMKVFKLGKYMSVWAEDMVAIASIDVHSSNTCIIDDVWVDSIHRGNKIFVKLLAFIKNEMKFNHIVLGKVHSDDTYNLLKSGGLRAFNKSWLHLHTNEVRPFDIANIDSFYGDSSWQLVLENSEDWSVFVRDNSFTHSYEALANAIELSDSLA